MVWLDVVTYLHHHGPSDPEQEMPWYRGEEWSYLRGGLTCIDRDCERAAASARSGRGGRQAGGSATCFCARLGCC